MPSALDTCVIATSRVRSDSIASHTKVLEGGGVLHQETRLWDVDRGETAVMRSKEEAHDYRYFPDPDLIPLSIPEETIQDVQAQLPELPDAKFARFVKEYGLPDYDTGILTASRPLADYFEACVSLFNQPKTVSNWVMGELLRELHQSQTEVGESPLSPEGLVELLGLVEDGTISLKVARDLFPELYLGKTSASELIQAKGLQQVSDEGALGVMVQDVMDNHASQVEQYRSGKDTVLGFLVGQVMKASGGKANPKKVNELLREALSPVSSNE